MTLTARREHAGGAAPSTLSSILASAATTISVTSATAWPTGSIGDFVVTVDRGTASEERILCESRTGNVLTVASGGRGYDGTVAREHQSAAVIEHTWSTTEADEASAHGAATNAHGVGTVAGLTEAQVMTNKELTAPTITDPDISDPAITGTVTGAPTIAGNPTFSGNPVFSGAPVIANFTGAAHDHGDADDGGTLAIAATTGLQAALDAKVDDSQVGAASGVASLDAGVLLPTAQLPSVPIAKIPTGTSGSTVAFGNHDHTIDAVVSDTTLNSRILNDGDANLVMGSVSCPAGTWLILATCRGGTPRTGSSARWEYDLRTSAGSLTGAKPVVVQHANVSVSGGGTVFGMLVTGSTATVDFVVSKVGTGAVVDTETEGSVVAIPLFGI